MTFFNFNQETNKPKIIEKRKFLCKYKYYIASFDSDKNRWFLKQKDKNSGDTEIAYIYADEARQCLFLQIYYQGLSNNNIKN